MTLLKLKAVSIVNLIRIIFYGIKILQNNCLSQKNQDCRLGLQIGGPESFLGR
jgi:hypothetical protein